jgi:enoyl-CoA hydratase/carnithine racemase
MSTVAPTEHTPPVLTIQGPRATIRLNRPREHNRMDPADLPVLMAHFTAAEADPAVRVVVLTGTGEKTFSSGYTLSALAGIDSTNVTFDAMLDRLENLAIPTIAAINGGVYGGATDLALCCDFRIGVKSGKFLMPASRIGLHYYPGGLRRYVERLGLAAAKRLFILGETLDWETLARMGFYDELVGPADLGVTVDRWVDQIVAGAPRVIRQMKGHLNAIARSASDEAAIRRDYEESLRSADLKEGLAALAAKRPPKFSER